MINISVDQKSRTALIVLEKMEGINKKVLKECWYDSGEFIQKRTREILDTGERTGTIYRLKGGRKHQASAPGEPPKTRTGALAKSIDYKVTSWREFKVGAGEEYAGYLEDGTEPMGGKAGARKYLIKAVNETSGDTIRNFYSKFAKELKK